MEARGRRGFALVSVLWILVGVSALALVATLAAREAVAAARNRADLARAAWRAEDCLERARAAAGDALLARRDETAAPDPWTRLDEEIARSPLLAGTGCDLRVRAAGAALDVNAASEEMIRRLLLAMGRRPAEADSLVDALADWRDADAVPRPRGAERGWYAANGLRPPRDGPIADARELAYVRGFAAVEGIDTLLSAEPGRVPLGQAPPAVLAALPGFGVEAAGRAAELRMRGERITDLAAFFGTLSQGARDEAAARFPELASATSASPEAWIVTARAGVGTPPARSAVEARLVRAGTRAAVVRRRTWIE